MLLIQQSVRPVSQLVSQSARCLVKFDNQSTSLAVIISTSLFSQCVGQSSRSASYFIRKPVASFISFYSQER